jgi:hypothetical protein
MRSERGRDRGHRDHDELLIARLYGEDLDAFERAAALDRIASCGECAALLAATSA